MSERLYIQKPNFDKLPVAIKAQDCLHLWHKELDKNGQPKKVPCNWLGNNSDPFDPDIYLPVEDTRMRIDNKAGKFGIAIALGEDGIANQINGSTYWLWCLDLDGFMHKDSGDVDSEGESICVLLNTYTEKSDSNTGAKAFFWSDTSPCTKFDIKFGVSPYASEFPAVGKYKNRTIEVFSKKRFLALSGARMYQGLDEPRIIQEQELAKILNEADKLAKESGGTGRTDLEKGHSKHTKPPSATKQKTANAQLTEESARYVLKHVNHHDEQTYTDVANALWRLYGEDGRLLYHECMSGQLANDPYPDYDENVVNDRFDRAAREKRETGYGWPHLIELARQHHDWNPDTPLEWLPEEFGPLTFIGENQDISLPCNPISEVNEFFAWDRNRMEIYDKRAGMYVKKDGFLTHYKNRSVTINGQNRTLGDSWLKHPRRAEINGLELAPDQGEITRSGALNIWKGYSCEPMAGDCSLFLEVLDHLIPNPEQAAYVLTWLARMIQNPAEQFKTALAIWGPMEGTGKNTVFEAVGELFSKDHYAVIGSAELASPFHDWQIHKIFVIGDEVCNESGDRALAGKMKRLVTASDNRINPKGKPAFTQPNLTKYVLLSSPR